ncbi:hypothetical protein TNCV_2234731 [Trichonephila clavipes]|nr:hypothetical protein TNCV_2234731 [Trichonephila clavipes]
MLLARWIVRSVPLDTPWQWTREGTHTQKTLSLATRKKTRREDRRNRAASTCEPHSDSFTDMNRRRRSKSSTNNFKTPCRSKSYSKHPFRALPLTSKHRHLRLQWCQARSI